MSTKIECIIPMLTKALGIQWAVQLARPKIEKKKKMKEEMLMDVLRIMINDPFKESFHEKIKKIINVLTIFLIFYKSGVKTFLK